MSASPEPLRSGAVLAGRFEIARVLGRGGFGIAYLAKDRSRGDEVVVKELAPEGSERAKDGFLDMDKLGAAAARLRRTFLDEAKLLSRLNLPGVGNVRLSAVDSGTAFYVTDYIPDAEALDQVLKRRGALPVDEVLDLGHQLMTTLEAVHARGVLHRDIKPANVLLRPNGQAILIDFGAAREWHADLTEHHTVLFTPGYAPIEQLSERARRGPATDVYGLCALLYALLTGTPPEPSTDRLNGTPLTPLRERRPEVDPYTAHAMESGLALHYAERPQTMAELRQAFSVSAEEGVRTPLEVLDEKLVALAKVSYGRRQCPSCGEVQQHPKPLAKGRCPVCERGQLTPRHIEHRLCPSCKSSILQKLDNTVPLAICPLCETGVLQMHKGKWLSKDRFFNCDSCKAHFVQKGDGVNLESGGPDPELVGRTETWTEWGSTSQRPAEIHLCDGCGAQYDLLPDGQWQQMLPEPKQRGYAKLYPDEWARVASGLDPGCGTHVCSSCEADYFVEGERVTLLGAHEDPFGFAATNAGRLLGWETMRWLGVGKSSPHPGPTCLVCQTEFDAEGEYQRLVRTSNRALAPYLNTLQTIEDWHRIARGLPRVDEQTAFEDSVEGALHDAYLTGEINFDNKGTLWKGAAVRLEDGAENTLTITPTEFMFGGLLRKDKYKLELLSWAGAEGDELTVQFRGEAQPMRFQVEDAELTVTLHSGNRLATLTVSDLAERLTASMFERRPSPLFES